MRVELCADAHRVARELAAELDTVESQRMRVAEHGFDRCVATQVRQVIVDPRDGAHPEANAQFPSQRAWRRRSYSVRAVLTDSLADTSGTATSHQAPPAFVAACGSVSITITYVRDAARARSSAAGNAPMSGTFSLAAPSAAACAAKSIGARSWPRASASRLLNGAPPVAFCRRLMQPKPRLSSRTITSFSPRIAAVAISEFNMR